MMAFAKIQGKNGDGVCASLFSFFFSAWLTVENLNTILFALDWIMIISIRFYHEESATPFIVVVQDGRKWANIRMDAQNVRPS